MLKAKKIYILVISALGYAFTVFILLVELEMIFFEGAPVDVITIFGLLIAIGLIIFLERMYLLSVLDITIEGTNVTFILFNNKKVKLKIRDIKKITVRQNGYKISLTNGKRYASYNVIQKLRVCNNGYEHIGIAKIDFPDAEFEEGSLL